MKKTVPIKRNYEFIRAYKKGKFFAGKYIILYVVKNRLNINRIGITVSRKYGKSVKRNRFKRLVRESYRKYEDSLKSGVDMVFLGRKQETVPEYQEIKKEMKFLLKKLDIMDNKKSDL